MRLFRVTGVALLMGVLAAAGASAQDACLAAAQAIVQERIQKSGADVAIAFPTLDGKSEWFLRADDSFHAASTMKIPVMIELFHQVREGNLKLDDTLVVKNEFYSLVDGSVYTLDPADDSEPNIYKAEGQTRTLAQLCEIMITASTNLATNLIIEKLGLQIFAPTARGLPVLQESIAEGKAVDTEASRQMIEILKRQKFNEAIPAGLPPNTIVAHKTGDLTKIHHDAAIVSAPRPFILVILVRGIEDIKVSGALMADITRDLCPATQ